MVCIHDAGHKSPEHPCKMYPSTMDTVQCHIKCKNRGGLRQNVAEPGSATWLAEGFGSAANTGSRWPREGRYRMKTFQMAPMEKELHLGDALKLKRALKLHKQVGNMRAVMAVLLSLLALQASAGATCLICHLTQVSVLQVRTAMRASGS